MSDKQKLRYVQLKLNPGRYEELRGLAHDYGLPSMQKLIELAIIYVGQERPDLIVKPLNQGKVKAPTTMALVRPM